MFIFKLLLFEREKVFVPNLTKLEKETKKTVLVYLTVFSPNKTKEIIKTMTNSYSDNIVNIIFNSQAVVVVILLISFDFVWRYKKDEQSKSQSKLHRTLLSVDHFYYLFVFLTSMALLLCNICIDFDENELYWSICIGILWLLFLVADWVITELATANLTPWTPNSIAAKVLIIVGGVTLGVNEILCILHYLDKTNVKVINTANNEITPNQKPSDGGSNSSKALSESKKRGYAYDTYIYANVGAFLAVDLYLEYLFARDIKFIAFHASTICAGK
ncbi:hypothetical protein RFI_10791 [Reticulomyxa filosa]|uniref:Uncharacterized protein n=1 Tax=Reticulomyxa filosa TaxID=46433 RepID=X6NJ47_RETFI|nr:hypothetical protein RFI_10791 [Reticulomyxa filosa]|eukprot:ETO26345.1 hypothetical protein RFI_10791 [Reticulomyxa filosa]